MRRRGMVTALVLLAFFAAGVVVSVAVAWGVEVVRAVRASRATSTVNTASTLCVMEDPYLAMRELPVLRVRSFGREEWIIDRPALSGSNVDIILYVADHAVLPWWVAAPAPGDGRGTASVALGFPLVCVKFDSDRQTTRSGPTATSTTMTYRGSALKLWFPRASVFITLPLRPIWSGLAVDGLVFGALVASPWWIRGLVRWRRGKRGMCVWCGYDLKGLGGKCPECGRD